jgi:sulfatase maturation enzyme AslB (radical SAM superfamily)
MPKLIFPEDLKVENLTHEPACWAPWMALATKQSLKSDAKTFSPCCVWEQSTRVACDTIDEYLHTPSFIDGVTSIKEGALNDTYCNVCIKKEHVGSSPDYKHFDDVLSRNAGDTFEQKKQYLSDNGKFIFLDIRPGNLCNLKCKTCRPTVSTSIAKEMKKIPLDNVLHSVYNMRGVDKDATITIDDDIFNYMDIKYFKILGGEPSIDPNVFDMLSAVDRNTIIRFTTNATNVNRQWIGLLEEFNDVRIMFSLDGAGSVFEYQRYPANWNTIKNNIGEYHENILDIGKGKSAFVMTNLLLMTLEDWIYEFDELHTSLGMQFMYTVLTNDRFFLNIDTIPEDIMNERAVAIEELLKSDISDHIKDNILTPTLNDINSIHTSNIDGLRVFFDVMFEQDKVRNQSLFDVGDRFVKLHNTIKS